MNETILSSYRDTRRTLAVKYINSPETMCEFLAFGQGMSNDGGCTREFCRWQFSNFALCGSCMILEELGDVHDNVIKTDVGDLKMINRINTTADRLQAIVRILYDTYASPTVNEQVTASVCGNFLALTFLNKETTTIESIESDMWPMYNTDMMRQFSQLAKIKFAHKGLHETGVLVFTSDQVGISSMMYATCVKAQSPDQFVSTRATFDLFLKDIAYHQYTTALWLLASAAQPHLTDVVTAHDTWLSVFGDHGDDVLERLWEHPQLTHDTIGDILLDIPLNF